MEQIRLQKFLAEAGIGSRRKCEEYIANGRVKVNEELITEFGKKIDPKKDIVLFDDVIVQVKKENYIYILLNKPIGYVTTVRDQFNRKTVLDLVKVKGIRLVPVGRLDMYTSGALILTNDGEFVYKVTHPKFEIEKTYVVTVIGNVNIDEVNKLRNGVQIDDYMTKEAKVKIIKYDKEKNITRLEIIIHEGKNREVRKMCEAINKKVLALHRSKIGNLNVKTLEIGNWRYLKDYEVRNLINSI